MSKRVKVSISLNAEEASFLYELIASTGNGGPLWYEDDEAADDPANIYTKEQRQAFYRLDQMLLRACRKHGVGPCDPF